jgi:hypothetical protein
MTIQTVGLDNDQCHDAYSVVRQVDFYLEPCYFIRKDLSTYNIFI